MAMLFITHDLELAAATCDRTAVMYAGRIVEVQPSRTLLEGPLHPYSAGLMVSRPSIDVVRKRLTVIPGRPVAAYEAGAGCAFATRCGYAEERCGQERPELVESGPGSVSCIRHAELADRLASVERSVDV